MKKLFVKIMFLALVILVPAAVMAEVNVRVGINIPLPPPIIFPAPPHVVVIPQTDVYAVPDIDADIFFYGGWWWRPWEDRWYRSRSYDRGWAHYNKVPPFHKNVPRGWRNDYREHRWKGQEWDSRPIPHREAEQNWRGWKQNKHWEKENNWGVKRMDRQPSGQQKKFNQRNDGFPRGEGPGPQRGPVGQQKKFNQRNDGPSRGDGAGPQGGQGRGHNKDRDDRGDRGDKR